jgi:hypothetical protein
MGYYIILIFILVFLIGYWEYQTQNCDNNCVTSSLFPRKTDSEPVAIDKIKEILDEMKKYTIWRTSLIVSLLTVIVVGLIMTGFSLSISQSLIIIFFTFIFVYLASTWIQKKYLGPNITMIDHHLDSLRQKIVQHLTSPNKNVDINSFNKNVDINSLNKNVDINSLNKNVDINSLNKNVDINSPNKNVDINSLNKNVDKYVDNFPNRDNNKFTNKKDNLTDDSTDKKDKFANRKDKFTNRKGNVTDRGEDEFFNKNKFFDFKFKRKKPNKIETYLDFLNY